MAGRRQILTDSNPIEFEGYPTVRAHEDGQHVVVGGVEVCLQDRLPSDATYMTWYDLPEGGGLQIRLLPSHYVEVQTPDCDEPDLMSGKQMMHLRGDEVESLLGEPQHFHAHGVAATRRDDELDNDGDLSFGVVGHLSDERPAVIVTHLSVALAAQLIACIEASADVNGVTAALTAEVDQARMRMRDLMVDWGGKPRCEAVDDLTGRRCKLAAGHPSAPMLSTLTDGKITMAGHTWEEAADGTDAGPAAATG